MNSDNLLQVRGIRKEFKLGGAKIEVLRQIDLLVKSGDSIAIEGKSGAGKSTLLHVLGTLERPTDGQVTFMGQDIFQFDESQLSAFRNRQIGFVFQFHYLMQEFSALENVLMPYLISGEKRRVGLDRSKALLHRVGLEKRMDHKPNQLSGGEQQRVAIARALMMNPKLLLTDEMTGNLDPATGDNIFELVQSIHTEFGMAIVSVTHDPGLAVCYRQRFELSNGALVRKK